MLRRLALAVAAAALLAACGGSGSGSSSSSSSSAAASAPSSSTASGMTDTPTASSSTSSAAPSSSSSTTTTERSTTSSRPPEVPKHRGAKHVKAPVSHGVHVDAKLTLDAAGNLRPPSLGIPAKVRVGLTIRNAGAKPRKISVAGTTLTVPAHGAATAQIAALKKGSYPIRVDGAPHGVMSVGVNPGP